MEDELGYPAGISQTRKKKRWNWESQAQLELKLVRIMKVNKRLYKYIGHKRKKEANFVPLLSVREVI